MVRFEKFRSTKQTTASWKQAFKIDLTISAPCPKQSPKTKFVDQNAMQGM